MDRYVGGSELEQRLRTGLKELGCKLLVSETYNHEYKLDFVLTNFERIARFPPQVGVQVTSNLGSVDKMEEFLHIQKSKRVTPKSLYLEVDPKVNLAQGGCDLVYGALVILAYGKEYEEDEVVGLIIKGDSTLEFYNLEDQIEMLKSQEAEASGSPATPPAVGDQLEGRIVHFNIQRGFGTIEGAGRRFFVHRSNCDDPVSKALWEASPAGRLERTIPVMFENAGNRRPDARNPEAIRVRYRAVP